MDLLAELDCLFGHAIESEGEEFDDLHAHIFDVVDLAHHRLAPPGSPAAAVYDRLWADIDTVLAGDQR